MTMNGLGSDTLTLYAAAATQTEQVVLGTGIVPAFTRHPAAMATQALVLDDLAPGRLRLGVGTSHQPVMADRYGVTFDRPLTQLREYLQVLRPLLHTGEVEFSGQYYQVQCKLPGAPETPVLISALRPKAYETAGELTDGAISWLNPREYLKQVSIPALQRGAERAGRERPPLVAHVSVSLTGTREQAREAGQREFAGYARLPFYQRMFADAGYPLNSDNTYTDELLDQLLVFGDSDAVGEQLSRLLDDGFDELLVMPVTVEDRESEEQQLLDLIGRL